MFQSQRDRIGLYAGFISEDIFVKDKARELGRKSKVTFGWEIRMYE